MKRLVGDSTLYESIVKWLRRLSSLATNTLVASSTIAGASPLADAHRWVDSHVSQATGISAGRLLVLLAIGWFLFLTQLKPRWIFFLPIYLVFWPIGLLVTALVKLTVVPQDRCHAIPRRRRGRVCAFVPSLAWISKARNVPEGVNLLPGPRRQRAG
jgi:hypothetical protein